MKLAEEAVQKSRSTDPFVNVFFVSSPLIHFLYVVAFRGLCGWLAWIWGGYLVDLLLYKLQRYLEKYK